MSTPALPGDRPALRTAVVFEPGGYARFAGTKVPPGQRVLMLIRVFVGDQWHSTKSKLFGSLFLLPALVMATIVIVRAKIDIAQIGVPHLEEAKWIMTLLAYLTHINAGFLLLGLSTQVAPLIARDGHEGALLLYFSRPVLRSHYLMARTGAAFLSSVAQLLVPALLLLLVMLTQYGLQPGGCPWSGAAGMAWWLALLLGQALSAVTVAALAALMALAAGALVRNPSSAPLAFGGTILASTAASWVLQAAWGRESAARAVDLHHALSSLWVLLSFPIDPSRPPNTAAMAAAGGLVLWIAIAAGSSLVLQRFLANPPLGKGRS